MSLEDIATAAAWAFSPRPGGCARNVLLQRDSVPFTCSEALRPCLQMYAVCF